MLKSITRTMLTSSMGFAWTLIRVGERTAEAAQSWGADDQHASFAEVAVWKAGKALTAMGERLELATNGLAVRLGYNDGAVSGMIAWAA